MSNQRDIRENSESNQGAISHTVGAQNTAFCNWVTVAPKGKTFQLVVRCGVGIMIGLADECDKRETASPTQ